MDGTFELTAEQMSAVDMMKNNAVGILTGGPGTGKTTTIKEILSWAHSQELQVALCAPTGKAAKRMAETTGEYAETIHRTLGARMGGDGLFEFGVNEEAPWGADLLVADELSMVTNNLMADLLRGIDIGHTKLLLVGDHGQLPSVGPGAVLRDLLAADCLPHVELTQIHRNSGEIVRICHAINKGKSFEPCEELNPEKNLNYRHIEADTPEHIRDIIRVLVEDRMPARGYDPVWDIQVISPTNNRTLLSCDGLNAVLQEMLNPRPPDGSQDANELFRLNDKVIQTKNKRIDGGYVVNGDIGQISEYPLGNGQMEVTFFDPERVVKMSKKINKLLLAYCITCHRMQGSEAPVVIIPVHKSFGYFVDRSWIYTAISRAQDICITVGQFSAIRQAAQRQSAVDRCTMLAGKLEEQTVLRVEI